MVLTAISLPAWYNMAAALIVSPVIKCFQIVTFACTRRKGVIAAPVSATVFLPFDGRAGQGRDAG